MEAFTQIGAGVLAGATGWTLLEYLIHTVGHTFRGRTKASVEHLAHHRDVLYFSSLPTKITAALPALSAAFAGGYFGVGLPFAVAFTATLSAGWSLYEWLHQEIHVRRPKSAYARWAARHHLSHHFGKPNTNFGVTSPIWDFVFRTYDGDNLVRLLESQRARLPWLAEGPLPEVVEVVPG